MYNCYIIGDPLNKPRSVKLWKKYFKSKKINSTMSTLIVKKKNIEKFFSNLKNNDKFLASAVTSPLKNLVYKYIIPGNTITKDCKSVNFIIKINNKIYGFNTDIIALADIINKLKKKNFLILGYGGVGKPLSKYLIKKKKKIQILTSQKLISNHKVKFVNKLSEIFGTLVSANVLLPTFYFITRFIIINTT
jgi:shikimate dehydrogenase